jgi:hypothetical protein
LAWLFEPSEQAEFKQQALREPAFGAFPVTTMVFGSVGSS